MNFAFSLAVMAFVSAGIALPTFASDAASAWTWIRSPQTPARGVAVLVHGLNLKPERMTEIGTLLSRNGIESLRVSLSGHRGDSAEFARVSRDTWLEDVRSAYREARKESDQRKLPLYFVGYSLGALLHLDLLNNDSGAEYRYDRMVLLAPAVSLRATSHLVKLLGFLGPEFVVPSFGPGDYRANSGTPMAAYSALFESLERLEKSGIRQGNTPTLIMIDPDDELVSRDGIAALIQRHSLSAWQLKHVEKRSPTRERSHHHLIVTEETMGKDAWEHIGASIAEHLR